MKRSLFLALLLASPLRAADAPKPKPYFPPPESKGGWRTLLPEKGDPTAAQKAAIAKTAGVDWDKLREAWKVNAESDGASGLLVIRHGYIVGEWYKDGDKAKAFNIYSSSKSYLSLALGLLLADGTSKLTLETKVYGDDFLPKIAHPPSDPRKADITLRHLLNMTSGVGGEGVPATAPFEAALGATPKSPFAKLKSEPGKVFHYSNAGDAHLVLLFEKAAGKDLSPFLRERLWTPIGVESVKWQKIGGDGNLGPYSQGFSGLETTPREHARFCYLAMHKGEWAGKRVAPAAHYDFAWTGTKAKPDYGAQWWLAPHFEKAGAPKDFVATLGAFHNDGFVVPSLDLVFVRLGDSRKFPKDFERRLVEKVLAAVKAKE